MTRLGKIPATFLLLCWFQSAAWAEEPTTGEAILQIKTRIYNAAKVRPPVLSRALDEAATIYRRIGVEIEWLSCPCDENFPPSELYLRIIPRLFPTMRSPSKPSHLGYAAAAKEGGVLAGIFYDRVERLTGGGDPSTVLGYAIAHELGHLLLGDNPWGHGPHSTSGIMRAPWKREDLKPKARELMQFTSEDAGLLRARVLERVRNEPQSPQR
jgi:hypothetical protein